MERLKAKDVAAVRAQMWEAQGRRCALTGEALPWDKAVLDHCHKTGHIRGVIHRGVNSLLGKLENNAPRYGVTVPQLGRMGHGLLAYLTKDISNMPLHPTFKTPEEKRERTNMLARKRREAKKEQP